VLAEAADVAVEVGLGTGFERECARGGAGEGAEEERGPLRQLLRQRLAGEVETVGRRGVLVLQIGVRVGGELEELVGALGEAGVVEECEEGR
jgi:hypothetical protein